VREIPLTVLRGFFMGAADVVPGVSGGTVALVFGIYHRLVEAVQTGSSALGHLLRGDVSGGVARLRSVEWLLLLPLLGGIALAVVSLAHLLETLLEERPVEMAGLFLGLVGGSVVIAWGLVRQRTPLRLVIMVVVGAVVFAGLGLSEGTTDEAVSQLSDPALWAFFGAGSIAICAMILPGVSGSFLLVVMGMYGAVLGAVTDRDVVALGLFLMGCVLGLAVFSQILHWALATHYDTVMAALIGLMLGSTRVLWPWPAGVESTRLAAPAGTVAGPIALMVAGFAVVVVVGNLTRRLEHRTVEDEADELQAT
jgi:putative membrane protein